MKSRAVVLAAVFSLFLSGCYTGSQFTLEAPNLNQPVSMTKAIHNNDLQVLTPAEYDELGRFAISFSGWSVGSPLSPNPRKDISEALNQIVKDKGGNGITQLTVRASNNPVNSVSAFLRGMCFLGALTGALMLFNTGSDKLEAAGVLGVSVAGIFLLPTVGDFTVEGMVVRIKQKNPASEHQ